MNIDEFKLLTKEQLIEYGKTIKLGSTYHSNKNQVTYKDSNKVWYEYTYNSNNSLLTFKDSTGYCSERTYDDSNNKITYKDSNGYYYELLCTGQEFNLMYDKNKKLYKAGCQVLDYKDCIEFFNTEGEDYIDAKLFMKTIHQNELDLLN